MRIEVHSILIIVERRTKAKKFLWSKTIGAFRITRLLLVMSPNVPTKVSCSHLWTNKINCNPKSIDKLPSGFYLRSEVSRDGVGAERRENGMLFISLVHSVFCDWREKNWNGLFNLRKGTLFPFLQELPENHGTILFVPLAACDEVRSICFLAEHDFFF